MADSSQKQQSVKVAEENRKEDAGKKGVNFGGTIADLGEKDAVGVGQGK